MFSCSETWDFGFGGADVAETGTAAAPSLDAGGGEGSDAGDGGPSSFTFVEQSQNPGGPTTGPGGSLQAGTVLSGTWMDLELSIVDAAATLTVPNGSTSLKLELPAFGTQTEIRVGLTDTGGDADNIYIDDVVVRP